MCERMYEILTLGCNYLNYEKKKQKKHKRRYKNYKQSYKSSQYSLILYLTSSIVNNNVA